MPAALDMRSIALPGFEVVAEIGQGTFARVYLARQPNLADRFVILKIAVDTVSETQTLARLQHQNIVPVYAAFNTVSHGVVCMPYRGTVTLQQVYNRLHKLGSLPISGRALADCFLACRGGTTLNSHPTKVSTHPVGSTQSRSHPEIEASTTQIVPTDSPNEEHGPGTATCDIEPYALPAELSHQVTELDIPGMSAPSLIDELHALTYPESVLWLGCRIAEGLAHAHDRGIMHRDLKPSNVLWADDGQPMLLDFNMAADENQQPSQRIGGTLEYMSPEDLQQMSQCKIDGADARSDLFSLGMVLHQFMTLTHPGGKSDWSSPFAQRLRETLERRAEPWIDARTLNRAVSPAVNAIIQKCLAHDPADRYQSAHDLIEDIRRHLADKPLRFAGNPSLRERTGKWRRRHPRLASWTTAATLIVILLFSGMAYAEHREQRHRLLEARAKHTAFQEDLTAVQFAMTYQTGDPSRIDEALRIGQRAIRRYEILDNPTWANDTLVQGLPEAERRTLAEEAGLLFYLLARAGALKGTVESRQAALKFSEQSKACFEIVGVRSTVMAKYLKAREQVVAGQFAEAVPLLLDVTRKEPRNVFALFLMAQCQDLLDQPRQAIGWYTACIAVWPDAHQLYFNRGLAHQAAGDYDQSILDFDEVLRRQPDSAPGCIARATSLQMLAKHEQAIADLNHALELGSKETRIYFLRALSRDALGENSLAAEDRAEGQRREPSDASSFIGRGYYRLESNPTAAIADFDKALELNPRSELALQNKAHALSEKLNRPADALPTLNRMIELDPDNLLHVADRGVLLARLGKTEAARKDANSCIEANASADVLYRAGCIYALTANGNPNDQRKAIQLVATAIRHGFGHEYLATDDDLKAIRSHPEFKKLLASVSDIEKASQPENP